MELITAMWRRAREENDIKPFSHHRVGLIGPKVHQHPPILVVAIADAQ